MFEESLRFDVRNSVLRDDEALFASMAYDFESSILSTGAVRSYLDS